MTENNGQLAKKMRFAFAKNSDDIEKAKQLGVPIKTEQATSWSVKAWQEWTMQRDRDAYAIKQQYRRNEQRVLELATYLRYHGNYRDLLTGY